MATEIDGRKLRERREDALLSQRELAEVAGVSVETVSRLETEEPARAYGRTVRRLARVLNVSHEELLKGEEER